jgi:hypothetical protein
LPTRVFELFKALHFHSVRIHYLVTGVGKQFEGQALLIAETPVTAHGVETYANYDCIGGFMFFEIALKIVRLERTSGSLFLWKKKRTTRLPLWSDRLTGVLSWERNINAGAVAPTESGISARTGWMAADRTRTAVSENRTTYFIACEIANLQRFGGCRMKSNFILASNCGALPFSNAPTLWNRLLFRAIGYRWAASASTARVLSVARNFLL